MIIKSKINKNKTKYVSRYTNKNKLKTKSKTNSINVYAKNMRYMVDDVEHKKLLTQLSNTLSENQWLKVSKDKYEPKKHIIKSKGNNYSDFKPRGSYYSKGGWIFHEDMCCNLDDEIILIEVDYSRIYRITGKEPYKSPITNSVYKTKLKSFVKDYGRMLGNDRCEIGIHIDDNISMNKEKKKEINNICKINKTEKNCRNNKKCYWHKSFKVFNWGKIYNNYNGFVFYPHPEMELMKNSKDYLVFWSFDVESLVLWDHTPVIKHHNLGTIREIIKEAGVKGKLTKEYDSYLSVFIPKLIEKITELKTL